MRRFVTAALIATVILNIAGCGTVLKGTQEGIHFTSDPDGALVVVNGMERGTTPLKLKLSSGESYTITFKKEGYENKTYVIDNHVQAGWIVLDVLFGLVPVVVDAATGGWYTLDQNNVNALMVNP